MDTQTNTKINFTELSTGICTDNYSFQLGEFFLHNSLTCTSYKTVMGNDSLWDSCMNSDMFRT